MADASLSETAGPSNANDADIEGEVKQAEASFQEGVQAIKANNLDRAVELFGQVLQTRCQQFGDVDIKCASTYFRYGAALFYKAQDEQDVFGSTLQAAAANDEADVAEDEESEDEKENVDDKGKKPMREEDLPREQGEGDEEADDSPGSRTDMELAWENLEVAKYIYEHQGQGSYAKELADIHTLLADIGMEQESFESAMTDHKRALELLSTVLQADDRRLAELHYKMSLALQYLDQPDEALKEIKTAVKIVETRIDNMKSGPAEASAAPPVADSAPAGPSTTAAAANASAQETAQEPAGAAASFQQSKPADTSGRDPAKDELTDLESVLEDMYEKVEELQQVLKEHLSTKNALKAAFSQIAGTLGPSQLGQGISSSSGAGPSSAPAAVVDLGVVGRGTKRVTPMPVLPSSAGTTSQHKPLPQKRSLEDLMGGGPVSATGALPVFTRSNPSSSMGFDGNSSGTTGAVATALQTSNSPWPHIPAGLKKQKTGLAEQSQNAAASGQLPVSASMTSAAQTDAQGKIGNAANKSALPAFLQPSSVSATYGSESANKD